MADYKLASIYLNSYNSIIRLKMLSENPPKTWGDLKSRIYCMRDVRRWSSIPTKVYKAKQDLPAPDPAWKPSEGRHKELIRERIAATLVRRAELLNQAFSPKYYDPTMIWEEDDKEVDEEGFDEGGYNADGFTPIGWALWNQAAYLTNYLVSDFIELKRLSPQNKDLKLSELYSRLRTELNGVNPTGNGDEMAEIIAAEMAAYHRARKE